MLVVVVFAGFGAAIGGHALAAWRRPRTVLTIGALATLAVALGLAVAAPVFLPLLEAQHVGRLYKNTGIYEFQLQLFRADTRGALDFDPRTTALVEHPPPLQLPSGPITENGTTRIVRYEPDQVEVDIDAPAAGLLVLTDQAYPGWEVRVNGQPAEILVTDYLFRGVPVPAGVHRVVFRFVPRSFAYGLAAGAAGLAVFGIIALGMRRWGCRPA